MDHHIVPKGAAQLLSRDSVAIPCGKPMFLRSIGNIISDVYSYHVWSENWHGLEHVKVEDLHMDMARSHRQQYRQRSQEPTHVLGIKQSN